MVDGFWGNIFRGGGKKESNDLSMLKVVPILDGLSRDELKEFERIVHHRHYKADENIFWEGEPGVGIYIIQEGAVRIYKTLPDGSDKELAILKNGDFFGEMALLDESPRSASAVAWKQATSWGYSDRNFLTFLRGNPSSALR